MVRGTIWRFGIVIAFISSLFLINAEPDRENFGFIAGCYVVAFAAYLFILREQDRFHFWHLAAVAILAQAVSIVYAPNLSDDFYRFLWDGELCLQGINPYDFTPNELTINNSLMRSPYMQELYGNLSDLSKENYSCYPPVNQVYFILSSWTSNIEVNAVIMKLLTLLTEILGFVYLRKLLIHFNVNPSRAWIFFLNPLLLIECTANLHFEGVMLSLLFVGFYFLFTGKMVVAGIFFALAVQIKLIPLIFLPFLLFYFDATRIALFYTVVGIVVVVLTLTLVNGDNVDHFMKSLGLYFASFEFNSFLNYHLWHSSREFRDFHLFVLRGSMLSRVTLIILLVYAWLGKPSDWNELFKRMLIGFSIYLALASTVHPWYLLTLLGISVFTNYTFPILWSFLIFFTYYFYSIDYGHSLTVRLLVILEYAVLITYAVYELLRKGSPFKFLRIDYYFQPKSDA